MKNSKFEHMLYRAIKKYRPNTVACLNVDKNGKPVSVTLTKKSRHPLPQEEIPIELIKESDDYK